jgi:DNA-directed RNA polymerase specialized sigma24 family protein
MVMHVLEHMDFAQIATILDLPVGKVREEYDRFALLLKAALTNRNGAQRNKGQENDNC